MAADHTRLDGVVYARSAFHHSLDYTSAVIHGTAREVTDDVDLRHGLRVLVEHLAPGSWEHSRPPNRKKLAAVTVLAWAGVLPLTAHWGTPAPCPQLPASASVPPQCLAPPATGWAVIRHTRKGS